MGFLHMLSVNRDLNNMVAGVHTKFHRLEDLINGHRGVDSLNFTEINTLISSISRDILEMTQRVDRLDYSERSVLLLLWTNGRKYPWIEWNTYALMCINQAKMLVNQYRPGYYQ
jgi:hypothetical protein